MKIVLERALLKNIFPALFTANHKQMI